MSKQIVISNEEKLENLAERIKAILVESVFSARMTLLEGKHKIGKEIVEDELYKKWGKGAGDLVERVGEITKTGKTELYLCIKFYQKYPEVSALVETFPGRKNDITWAAAKRLLTDKPIGRCNHDLQKITCWECKKCQRIFKNKPEKL